MKLTRREFIKTNAIAAAATTAGMSIPGVALAATPQSQDGVRWDKGVCRYCGTGCGVLVGVKDGRVVEGNYDQYPILRTADVPKINIHFGGLTGHERFAEIGEPPVGPVGPAITNAIFAATGKRLRSTPILKHDLSWA